MTTALDRDGRDQLAALVDQLPATPAKGARNVRVDEALLDATVALLGQFSLAFAGEPIGRAAGVLADRLQLSVPMTALLAMKDRLEASNLDVR